MNGSFKPEEDLNSWFQSLTLNLLYLFVEKNNSRLENLDIKGF